MTIIMIAHRLQTIMTADNLLFLDNDKQISAEKGTEEYNELIDRLMKKNYAHQADNDDEEEIYQALQMQKDMYKGQLSSAQQ